MYKDSLPRVFRLRYHVSLIVALIVFSCGYGSVLKAGEAQRPNVLLIFTDDQREDTIAAFGNPHIQTPNLDTLAANSVVLTNMYCMGGDQPAVCAPSRKMLLTGDSWFRRPTINTVPPPNNNNFALTMEAAGYETYFCGKTFNSASEEWGHFQHKTGLPHPREGGLPGNALVDTAISYLEDHQAQRAEKPFFMYLAGPTPHHPYGGTPDETIAKYEAMNLPMPPNFRSNPEPLRTREVSGRRELTPDYVQRKYTDPYHGTMDHFDGQMGRLFGSLQAKGLYDNTIIIFTTDQGIAHGHHGCISKQNLYECTMNVPFIIRGPGIGSPGAVNALAYLFDVFPTVCALVGIAVPDDMQGKSFAHLLRDPHVDSEHRESVVLAYTTSAGQHVERAIRMGDLKLYYYPETESYRLFNLAEDPSEINNVTNDPVYTPYFTQLKEKMIFELRELGDPGLSGGTTVISGGTTVSQ